MSITDNQKIVNKDRKFSFWKKIWTLPLGITFCNPLAGEVGFSLRWGTFFRWRCRWAYFLARLAGEAGNQESTKPACRQAGKFWGALCAITLIVLHTVSLGA